MFLFWYKLITFHARKSGYFKNHDMKLFCLLLLLPSVLPAQSIAKKISNAYFNQSEPGNEPVLFAPEFISDEFGNRDMAVSPGGDELFYTFQYRGGFIFSTIMYSKK